jgi:Rhs element Vgr protein
MSVIVKKIEVKIDGKKLDEYSIHNTCLTQEVLKPNRLVIRIDKQTLAESEKEIRFQQTENWLGKKIEYRLEVHIQGDENTTQDRTDVLEFEGIVFNVKNTRRSMKEGLIIEIIAYSPDYLLCDNPHCYSYENKKMSEIFKKTIEPYDIPNDNHPAFDEPIQYAVQYNETNYDFIARMAKRFGEWFYYEGKELVFGKVKNMDCGVFHPGHDILSYDYDVHLDAMNFSHAHHNYLDVNNIITFGNDFIKGSLHNMTDAASNESKSLYTKPTFQHLKASDPEGNFDETECSAKTQTWGKQAHMMVCQGAANRADLRIGSSFTIKEDYRNDEGKASFCEQDSLLVFKVVHTTNGNRNYENEFFAIPNNSELPPYYYSDNYPVTNTQRAVVMDNKDPEKLGRVRVQFLWQKEQDKELMTPWIRIAQPHGGDNKGFYFIPEIDEEVMVGFENGNAEKPYVMGTLYHGEQLPGSNWYSDSNDIKAIRTRNGHTIEIHDEDQGGFIKIYDNEKGNYILTFSTDEQLIRLQSSGNIELRAENDIIIDAKNNIKISAGVDLSQSAGENMNENAGKNVIIGAKENMAINAGNDMDTHVGNNDTRYVSSNQTIEIGANKEESIAEKYQLTAETIREEATDKLELYGELIEQRAEKTLKFDGGKTLDLFAKNIRMN